MVSIKDTKKYASEVSLRNETYSFIYHPLEDKWTNGINGTEVRSIGLQIDGKQRTFDLRNKQWYDQCNIALSKNIEEIIKNKLREIIENSNPSIRMLKDPGKRNLISMVIKDIHSRK